MFKKIVNSNEISVNQHTIYEITKRAVDDDISPGDALDEIVREWSSSKEIEPVNSTPKSPDLRVLQNTFDNIQKRLNGIFDSLETVVAIQAEMSAKDIRIVERRLESIETKLADASFCNIKKE